MNTTFDYLTGNRKWLVRDFTVWGDSGIIDAAIVATENLEESNIVFLRELVGGQAQVVEYTDLSDHRGNSLPESIAMPEVILIAKNHESAFIIGIPGNGSFRIAGASRSSVDPVVDLLIMEMR
jgi:hypothetical protein